jgi:hypothetical protein
MAVKAAQDAGITASCHIAGGIAAWTTAQGQISRCAA